MSDFYQEILALVEPELTISQHLGDISARRGVPIRNLVQEALLDFLGKEFVSPKSPETDYELAHPCPAAESVSPDLWPWGPSIRHLPLVSTCPPDKLEVWLDAVLHDIQLLTRTLAGFSQEDSVQWSKSFVVALRSYERVRDQLLNRIEQRNAGKEHTSWDGYIPGSGDLVTVKE